MNHYPVRPSGWLPLLVVAVAIAAGGCGARPHTPALAPLGSGPADVQPPPPGTAPDPIARLLRASSQHDESGRRELELGHVERARAEFVRGLELLAEHADGVHADARVREQFDRLVSQVSALGALERAEGDGLTERPYEPAPIDEILAATALAPPEAPPDLGALVEEDLRQTNHDIPIPLNERVLSHIELMRGRLRDQIADGLRRGAQYLPMIQAVFRAEGLPLDLAYLPLIESAFKPTAVSRAKAKGVWQFMRGTAREHGLRYDWYIDERSDPEKATRAAAKYLKSLNGMFGGDWHLALASYNGGPGRVQRALKRARLEDFWALEAKGPRYLPRETREYVPMALAAIVIARNPARYGFSVQAEERPAEEFVQVPGAADLRRIAQWAGVPVDELQALNPELRRWTTPPREATYQLGVPVDAAGELRARLATADAAELNTLRWYIVKRGDSLVSIARKLGVTRADLADANYLSTRSHVRTGQKLVIPRMPAAAMAARARRPAPPGGATALALGVGGAEPERADQSPVIYTVKPGDTLYAIARLFQTSVDALKGWNRLRSDRIVAGARLRIYARAGAVASW